MFFLIQSVFRHFCFSPKILYSSSTVLSFTFILTYCTVGVYASEVPSNGNEDNSQIATLILADFILLCFAALFAGLTLSIMGLDTLSLEIIADSGTDPDKSNAQKILPIRQLGNQLLCTLVLGNVIVNTLIAQITDSHIHGWIATVISTALITLGGEILPQALMSAHALKVGSRSAPIVKLFVILFFPICKPLSMFLDAVIGTDPGQIYERNELKRLMFLHASHTAESGLAEGEVDLIMGAMELHEKTVMDIMTPISEVFMLEAHEWLAEETIQTISERGHSRIPVYQENKNNVIGILFAKDLLMMRPEECTRVIHLVQFYHRRYHVVQSDTKLIKMLSRFQTGRSHIALVQEVRQPTRGDPYYEIQGLVTLEDVIEELIHNEIFDEYDIESPHRFSPPHSSIGGMVLGKCTGLTLRNSRRIFLNINEFKACALFLLESLPGFQLPQGEVNDHFLLTLAQNTVVYHVRAPKDPRGLSHDDKNNVWLYRYGVLASYFILCISGNTEVFIGKEMLPLELHSWATIGVEVLARGTIVPNFSCRVVSDSRIMEITQAGYQELRQANMAQLNSI